MSTDTVQWYDAPRWSVAHRLHPRPPEEFLGATYWTTLCGKRVRADRVEAYAPGQRPAFGCETCERAGQAPGEEETT